MPEKKSMERKNADMVTGKNEKKGVFATQTSSISEKRG